MRIGNAIRMSVYLALFMHLLANALIRNLVPFVTDSGTVQRFGWPATFFVRTAEIDLGPDTWLLTPAEHITWSFQSVLIFSMNIVLGAGLALAFVSQVKHATCRAAKRYGRARLVVFGLLFLTVFAGLRISDAAAMRYLFGSPIGILMCSLVYGFPLSLFVAICGLLQGSLALCMMAGARKGRPDSVECPPTRNQERRLWIAFGMLAAIFAFHGVLHAVLYEIPFDPAMPPGKSGYLDRYGWPLAFVGLTKGDPLGLADFATVGTVIVYPIGCVVDILVVGFVSAISAATILRVVSRLGYLSGGLSASLWTVLFAAVLLAEYNRFASWAAPYPPVDASFAVLDLGFVVTHTWHAVVSISILRLFWWVIRAAYVGQAFQPDGNHLRASLATRHS